MDFANKNKYSCKSCGKTFMREGNAAWIMSWCTKTNKNTRIYLVKKKPTKGKPLE